MCFMPDRSVSHSLLSRSIVVFVFFILGFTECVVTLSKKVTLITHYCVSTFMRQAGEAPGQLLWA